jgi:transcriptional regulator with XRE-family HTH domain
LVAVLKRAVENSGVSLSELARRSGVSHSQISRFVRGERLLALDAASKLFDALGLQIVEPEEPPAPAKKPAPKKPNR